MSLTQWIAADGTILALDGTEGVSIRRGASGFDSVPIHRTIDPRVTVPGSTLVQSRRPHAELELPLFIDTDTISTGTVIRLFQEPGILVASSGRFLRNVVYVSGFEGQWTIPTGGVTGLTHRQFALDLIALDPTWYGPIESATGTFGAPTAWNAAIPWNSAIPWNGGASTTVTVDGDEPAHARILVLADASPVTEVTFSIDANVGWTTAQTIGAGDVLTVDSRVGRKGPYLGSVLLGMAESPVDHSLLTGASQIFDLPVGDVEITYGVVSAGTPTWWIWWEPRWISP